MSYFAAKKEPKPAWMGFVFAQVMYNARGQMTYDWVRNKFLIYFKPDAVDVARCPTLAGVGEIWLALHGKDDEEN